MSTILYQPAPLWASAWAFSCSFSSWERVFSSSASTGPVVQRQMLRFRMGQTRRRQSMETGPSKWECQAPRESTTIRERNLAEGSCWYLRDEAPFRVLLPLRVGGLFPLLSVVTVGAVKGRLSQARLAAGKVPELLVERVQLQVREPLASARRAPLA